MEVLAPVGSKDALKAAVLGGADAVYLGGKRFGARRMASNFGYAGLKGAVRFAHENGVKVFVTVNTLIKEREMESALSFVGYLDSIGADAVILQDRGLMRLVQERFAIPIHASTQMGIHSPEGARWARENGIRRIILSRELSLEEIARIRKAVDIGLEVFVHGALCYSFSGKCLFSSMVGGRSGNRGLCAQPCRKRYLFGGESAFHLSTADLFCVEDLPALMDLGVDAIKIEGRMRAPLYTYLTSKAYSSAIGRIREGGEIISDRERELLGVVFNRGFTRGYLGGGEVVQRDFADSRGLPLGGCAIRSNVMTISARSLERGDGVTLWDRGRKVGGFELDDTEDHGKVVRARVPFDIEDGEYLVYKTKDRDFDDLLARIASMDYEETEGRVKRIRLTPPDVQRNEEEASISCYVDTLNGLRAVLPFADRIYYEMNVSSGEAEGICSSSGKEFVLIMPSVSPVIPDVDQRSLMISTLGQFRRYRGRRLYGHYSMSLFNSQTVPELYQYTASPELSRDDLKALSNHFDGRLEVLTFGRLELMVTRDCSLGKGELVDERGYKFPVRKDTHGLIHVLNSVDLLLLDHLSELERMGVGSFGLDLRGRHAGLSRVVARAFASRDTGMKEEVKRLCGGMTRGHYLRGVR